MNWNCDAHLPRISMPYYEQEVLQKFHNPTPKWPKHPPRQLNPPNYGSKAPQITAR